jgi:phosphate transport system substrate-binding protein
MFQQLAQEKDIQVNYQAIGSGGGKEQFTNKTVDFGASDAPMTDEEMQKAGGDPQHIATVGGAVVATYNVEGVQSGLKLEGQTLADIFQGKITKWNDPAIAIDNPGVNLPDAEIAVVHRSDGSGTTNIFSSYLSAVSSDWKSQVGEGTELQWPTGIGAKGNDGVSGEVLRTPNTIGYVELTYATENSLPYASIQNANVEFVEPSPDSARAAIEDAKIPDDLRVTVSSTDPQGSGVYPITGLTWLLVRQQQDDLSKCQAVAQMAWYVTHDGQSLAPQQNYVQLPHNVVSSDEQKIKDLQAEGQSCYQQ